MRFCCSRYVVCTDETITRRRGTTSVEEIPTKEQPTHPDTAPAKHDKINQKPTNVPILSPPASQNHSTTSTSPQIAHAQKQVPTAPSKRTLQERGLGDMQSWYLAGWLGAQSLRFLSFVGLDTACCAVPRLGMHGGAPGGWVVGWNYWGQGLWYSGVGFWFVVTFCAVRGQR